MRSLNRYGFGVILLAAFIASCSTDQKGRLPTHPTTSNDALIESLVAAGFRADEIEDHGTYFVIEGDIVVRKADIRTAAPGRATPQHVEQYQSQFLVSMSKISSVRVKIDPSISAYTTDIVAAFTAWNNVSSKVVFVQDATTPDVTVYMDNAPNVPPGLGSLGTACGAANLPPGDGSPGPGISINHNLIAPWSSPVRRTVLEHEFGHTVGFHHSDPQPGELSFLIPGTPTSDPNSVMIHNNCGLDQQVDAWDATACFQLYPDGKASTGTSDHLDLYVAPYGYAIPGALTSANLVKLDIAGSSGHVYAWYTNGTASSGTSNDLDAYAAPYAYTLPSGYVISDIAGIAIAASNDHVYVWYKNGYASSGNSSNLAYYLAPYAYTLPPGYTANDIVDMAINSQDRVYTWYKNGKVSIGNSGALDFYSAPYTYTPAAGYVATDIVGIGIARSTGKVYAWYNH